MTLPRVTYCNIRRWKGRRGVPGGLGPYDLTQFMREQSRTVWRCPCPEVRPTFEHALMRTLESRDTSNVMNLVPF
jgi:hypothetical protein